MKKVIQTLALGAIISGLASCSGSSPAVSDVGIMPGGPVVIDSK